MQGTAGKGQGGKEGNEAVGSIVLFVEGLPCSVFGTCISVAFVSHQPS